MKLSKNVSSTPIFYSSHEIYKLNTRWGCLSVHLLMSETTDRISIKVRIGYVIYGSYLSSFNLYFSWTWNQTLNINVAKTTNIHLYTTYNMDIIYSLFETLYSMRGIFKEYKDIFLLLWSVRCDEVCNIEFVSAVNIHGAQWLQSHTYVGLYTLCSPAKRLSELGK
jgi:hypothetical protein